MKAKTSRILGFMFLMMLVFAIIAAIWNAQQKRSSHKDEISFLRQLADVDEQRLADVLDHSLVSIPAGYFLRGSNEGNYNEGPEQSVYLNGFEIDRYEVTNSQYVRFIRSTNREAPSYWNSENYPDGQADFPVVGVSWNDANAYCTWAGKRLPTEAEWEKACRGPDGRQYPWGNDWDPRHANVGILAYGSPSTSQAGSPTAWAYAWQLLKSTPAADDLGLRPVGSRLDGASPYGVLDLVGNASEWVFDWYNWGDYSEMPTQNPVNLEPPWNHCVRGSAWHDPAGDAGWVQAMSRCPARNSAHAISDPRIGFRCARSVLSGEK